MRIVCFSDTHRTSEMFDIKFPEADVLIFAGDDDWQYSSQVKDFNRFLKTIPIKNKIIVAGNHDFYAQQPNNKVSKYLTEAIYLQSSGCEINGIKFWGSPYTPIFGDWAFMLYYNDLVKEWNKIPKDTNVLITHGPPFGVLDNVPYGAKQRVGCTALKNRIEELTLLKLHVFGHIHDCHGELESVRSNGLTPLTYVNASICDEDYNPTNKPILVEINI